MSDWRPYEPSLEAERSAVYERSLASTLLSLSSIARAAADRIIRRNELPAGGGDR